MAQADDPLPKRHALHSFLCDAFTVDEFRGLIELEYGRGLTAHLSTHASPSNFFMESIALLERHGLLTPEFFKRLSAARPAREHEIRAMQTDPEKLTQMDAKLELRLSGNLTDLDPTRLDLLIDTLRKFAGERGLYVLKITSGSIKITLVGPTSACNELARRFQDDPASLKRHVRQESGLDLLDIVATTRTASRTSATARVVTGRVVAGSDIDAATIDATTVPDEWDPNQALLTTTALAATPDEWDSDQALLTRWRERGSKQAAQTLYRRHFDAVYRFFRTKVVSLEDGSDLTSETFMKLFHRRATYPSFLAPTLRPYIFGIARHVLFAYVRKRARLEEDSVDLAAYSVQDLLQKTPESTLYASEQLNLISRALRTLPLQDQILLEAKHFSDCSEAELASMLDIPRTYVPGRLRAARQRLQTAVRRTGSSMEINTERTSLEELLERFRDFLDSHPASR